ncbi:pH-response regulator protein palA/RIM20 [Mycena sanguinolenta]|uniref:pH-response regulator protein palA/RIM20 n=1 Tax=Mycena sanguinolenta TaxID=230812 RepID=A0A8H6ZDG8_9AGAR|nr:pH-response regulator protein palA/RIM20 [Mycena sanguinolenta]
MSNLLALPFKKTYNIDIKEPVRNYLLVNGAIHPDAFKNDINRWQNLRKGGVGGVVHVDGVNAALSYHAQLLSVLTKLPTDIGVEISYAPVFSPTGLPITLRNIAFERAAVLFNLAALYSQLAASEDRSTADGIKRAIPNYQAAAGTLSYLRTSVVPKLMFASDEEEIPLDLAVSFVHGLEWLMLAQAQECWWQNAKLNNYKNPLLAKLATHTAALYRSAITTIREAEPLVQQQFPSGWLPHIEAKQYHFEAVSQYRQSLAELEASKYGVELARLEQARVAAKRAHDIARRGKVAPAVLQDVQSLLDTVQKDFARAERDNDLIYHESVPAASALPPIAPSAIAQLTVVPGLLNPESVVGPEGPIFAEMIGWGAQEAINIYNDRKQNLVKDKIADAAQRLKDEADETLRVLNLPSSLEALERSAGLPPSLLQKAEQVRLEDGPAKIEAAIADVHRLAQQDTNILDDAMDILDNEASEDETMRREAGVDRPPSHEANVELVEKERRYRDILGRAATSDETVRQKWDEWEGSIVQLAADEADLEALVPSSTRSQGAESAEILKHSRALRVALEALDSLHRELQDFVRRAQSLADADDIYPRVLSAASGLEKLAEVKPEMFEDVSDQELAKYDKFLEEINKGEAKQAELLSTIEASSISLLSLVVRREDPSLRAREDALLSLDHTYQKYREIVKNLNEGIQFYNDLAQIFNEFKAQCKTWSQQRSSEVHALARLLQVASLEGGDARSPPPRRAERHERSSARLPALTSSDWGFEEVPLPPGPSRQ